MIEPGGASSVLHAPAAVTRMNNNLVNAARLSMPFNAAAQASLRNQTSSSHPSGPPVGPTGNVSAIQPQPVGQVALPTGGPVGPPQPDFDPEVFKENLLDTVVGEVRTQNFMNSARVKDAATSVRLKNVFNATNDQKMPDDRNLLEQVINRMGY